MDKNATEPWSIVSNYWTVIRAMTDSSRAQCCLVGWLVVHSGNRYVSNWACVVARLNANFREAKPPKLRIDYFAVPAAAGPRTLDIERRNRKVNIGQREAIRSTAARSSWFSLLLLLLLLRGPYSIHPLLQEIHSFWNKQLRIYHCSTLHTHASRV